MSRHAASRRVASRQLVSATHSPPPLSFLFTALVVFRPRSLSLSLSLARQRNARTRAQALLKALSARLKLSSPTELVLRASQLLIRPVVVAAVGFSSSNLRTRASTHVDSSINHEAPLCTQPTLLIYHRENRVFFLSPSLFHEDKIGTREHARDSFEEPLDTEFEIS